MIALFSSTGFRVVYSCLSSSSFCSATKNDPNTLRKSVLARSYFFFTLLPSRIFSVTFITGFKEVRVQPRSIVEFIQHNQFFFGIVTAVSYRPSHHRVVLLFYKAVVILPVGPAPREDDLAKALDEKSAVGISCCCNLTGLSAIPLAVSPYGEEFAGRTARRPLSVPPGSRSRRS